MNKDNVIIRKQGIYYQPGQSLLQISFGIINDSKYYQLGA